MLCELLSISISINTKNAAWAVPSTVFSWNGHDLKIMRLGIHEHVYHSFYEGHWVTYKIFEGIFIRLSLGKRDRVPIDA